MRQYRISVNFYSPMVFYDPPMFDALVGYAWLKKNTETMCRYITPHKSRKYDDLVDEGVKKHIKFTSDGVPLCTFMLFDGEPVDFTDSWKKRWESKYANYASFGKAKRRINTASGKYRSYNMPLPGKLVKSGYWEFFGDKAVVGLLEKTIWGIGKKSGMGFGIVDDYQIDESKNDELFILKNRPVPLSLARQYGIIDGTMRYCSWIYPYWDKRNFTECIISNSSGGGGNG